MTFDKINDIEISVLAHLSDILDEHYSDEVYTLHTVIRPEVLDALHTYAELRLEADYYFDVADWENTHHPTED